MSVNNPLVTHIHNGITCFNMVNFLQNEFMCVLKVHHIIPVLSNLLKTLYSRLSLSRNRRNPQKQFEISVLRHIRFVVLRKKQFEQPIFTNDYVI